MEQLFDTCAITFVLQIKLRILFNCEKNGVKHLLKARSVSCKELLRLMEPWFVVRIRHVWANSIVRLFIRGSRAVLGDKVLSSGVLWWLAVRLFICSRVWRMIVIYLERVGNEKIINVWLLIVI